MNKGHAISHGREISVLVFEFSDTWKIRPLYRYRVRGGGNFEGHVSLLGASSPRLRVPALGWIDRNKRSGILVYKLVNLGSTFAFVGLGLFLLFYFVMVMVRYQILIQVKMS